MTTMTCPNCRHLLEITVAGPEPTARERYKDTAELTSPAVNNEESLAIYRAVSAMVDAMAHEGVEVITSRDVADRYERDCVSQGLPRLNPVDLARALKACGAAKWRNAKTRGFKIPDTSHLDREKLGTQVHIPHVKGRSFDGDVKAFYSISRTPDGQPVFDDEVGLVQPPASRDEQMEIDRWKRETSAREMMDRGEAPF